VSAEVCGIVHGMPEASYHSHPSLSSTGARALLRAPKLFRHEQAGGRAGKRAFDVGHAVHAAVLGVGQQTVTYPDEHLTPSRNVSTSKATVAWAEEQRAAGLVPVSPEDAVVVAGMREAVLADPDARSLLEGAAGREVSVFAEVDGVPVRARFDVLGDGLGGDLKSGRDASPAGFNRAVGAHGYHIQQQWYDDAHNAATGARLEEFKFIAVEVTPPFLVGVYDLDFMWMDAAARAARKARDRFRECVESGVWPGYGAMTLTAPTWAVYDEDETELKL
jgi:hypothetical protein